MSEEGGISAENRKGALFYWVGLIISLVIIIVLVVILFGTVFENQTQAATVAMVIIGAFMAIAVIAWVINTMQRRKRRQKRLDVLRATKSGEEA